MNTRKAKLDAMLQARRPIGLKTSLGYVGEKHNMNGVNKNRNLEGVFRRESVTKC